MTHCMKLQAEPFEMIKSGQKTIEMRLFDEKRRRITFGDTIVFSHAENGEELCCKVSALHWFPSFAALYEALPLLSCGYTEKTVRDASPEDMTRYYSKEDEVRYGVLGIGIELL